MILIVDDDDDVRATIRECLEALSYEVVEATNGRDALAVFARQRPELIILDYLMPDMDGAEVARRVRATDRDVPIVFASGYADITRLRQAAGPDVPILHKPFQIGELAEIIASNRKGGAAETAKP